MAQLRTYLLASVLWGVCGVVFAEPPAITGLYPAGVQQGERATVSLIGKPGTEPLETWCSRDDVVLSPTNKPAEWVLTTAKNAPPGLCWVRFFNAEGASSLRSIVVGQLPESTEAEPNDDWTAPHDVPSLPIVVNGQLIKSGDVDTYAVNLEAGQTLVASVDAHRTLASPMDPVMQLLSPRGFVIEQNDDHHGNDPRIVFTAPQAGTYFVRMFAFPADPNSSISFSGAETYVYRLTLTTGPFVNHVAPLALGDASRLTMPVARGWNLPDDPLRLSVDTNVPRSSPVFSVPTSLILDRLPRVSHPTLLESELPTDTSPATLTMPVSVTSSISQPEETDVFTFTGTKGQSLAITADAHSFDSPLDPLLKVFGPEDKLLKEADDESRDDNDSHLTVTLPADGTYRIELTDRFGHGDEWSVYLLTLQEDVPRYELTLAADSLVLEAGKPEKDPFTIPVTITRSGGFNKEITLRLHGLPDGVSVSEMVSHPSGDSSKSVNLTLEAAGDVRFSGPLRVLGTIDSGETVVAQSPAPVEGLHIDSIWLTIVPGK
ncbi:MAG: PPC domain-containing protein [Planctomycetaceae bacterium]|nr:PPC domain-containing protein [Planctomycetaceae bacterium]